MKRTFAWKDRSSWPAKWPPLECEPDDYRLLDFAEDVRRQYDAIRCFHAARPIDVESYYRTGLRLSNFAELVRHAKSVLGSPTFPPISEAEFDQAVDALDYSDNGKLYVALDDRHLVESAGHYLIYGSEYIMAIAAHLPSDRVLEFQRCLRTIGAPTMYEVDVSIEFVASGELAQLAWWIARVGNERGNPPSIDFTFVLREPLPAERIITHYHPNQIPDWHNGGAVYVW